MNTHNYQVSEKRFFEPMHKIPDNIPGENLRGIKFREMHHINLPNYEDLELWYEDSITPIRLQEFQNP